MTAPRLLASNVPNDRPQAALSLNVNAARAGGYSPPVWATALVVGIGATLAAGGVGLMVRSRRLSRRRMDAGS